MRIRLCPLEIEYKERMRASKIMENHSKLNSLIPYEVINNNVLCGFSAIEGKILSIILSQFV